MRPTLLALPLLVVTGVAAALIHTGLLSDSRQPQWTEINEGLPSYAIPTALAFDAGDDDLVYAAVYYKHGVYRSEDGGRTWQQADQGLDGAPVYALAASPSRPGTVYAGAADGLYLSTDAARSWRRLLAPEKPIYALLVSHDATDHIYAGSFARLYVSKNGGESWASFTRGLEGATLLSLVANKGSPETLYAGTSGGGLLGTTDGGVTWSQLFTTKTVIAAVAVLPEDGTIFARAEDHLLCSADGGHRWENLGALPGGRRPLSILASLAGGDSLLAGSDGDGIFLTEDGGATWRSLGEGLARGRVTALAASANNPRRLAAGTPHGVFFSLDGGLHWERGKGIGRPIVRGLILAPGEDRLLAGTTDGVYERSDGGWHPLGQMQEETLVLSLALAPGRPEAIYAGTWGASVQRSIDGGQTWQLSASGHYSRTIIPSLLVDPDNASRLYARVEYDRLIVSDDGGDNWRPSDVGLMGVTVFAVAAAPTRAGLLYAGTDKGIYRSVDRGATWFSTGKVPWSGSTFVVVVDPENVDHLQAGTTGGVFHSRDGGQTWAPAKGLEDTTVSALVFSSGNPKRGFAGTRFRGVYQTEDAGATWRPLGQGLADATVNVLVLDEKAKRLVAATEEGVFALVLPDDWW